MANYDDKSWGAERALVMSKLTEFTANQKELFDLHHTLSTSVTVIKTKLGLMVTGVATVVSIVVSIGLTFFGAKQ